MSLIVYNSVVAFQFKLTKRVRATSLWFVLPPLKDPVATQWVVGTSRHSVVQCLIEAQLETRSYFITTWLALIAPQLTNDI